MSKPLRRLDRDIGKNAIWIAIYADDLTFQVTHIMLT